MLREHEAKGALVRFVPTYDPDESERRELFMLKALEVTLFQHHPKRARDYTANVRAFLGRFVKGYEIDNETYMKSWKDDIWEFRAQNQRRKDRIRIFGAFGCPDCFVALFRRPRDYFGDSSDPNWDVEIQRAVDEWDRLFPGCRRVP